MVILKVNHIDTKILNAQVEQIEDIKDLISYSTKEFYRSKSVTVKRTLYNLEGRSFPTGLLSNVVKYLKKHNIKYEIEDSREVCFEDSIPLYNVTPRDYQLYAVEQGVKKQRGIVLIATGGGKTVVAAAIIAQLNVPTMFCVHTIDLLKQTYDEFSKFLQVPIGIVGGGQVKIEKFNICMIQTLGHALNFKYIPADEFDTYAEESPDMKSKMDILKMINATRCVIVDECHHYQMHLLDTDYLQHLFVMMGEI